jgi:hypothetical protein
MDKETPGGKTNPGGLLMALLQYRNICGLKTLFALGDFEFDFIPLVEGLESIPVNGGVVDKQVIPVFSGDEPIALLLVKPFNLPLGHHNSPPSY